MVSSPEIMYHFSIEFLELAVSCSGLGDGELKVGNIRDSSVETVIKSEAAKKLRASMLGHQPLPSVCQSCQAKPVRREDDI